MDTYGLKVTHVAKGSQASKAGVRKGDEVHSINEKVYSDAYVKAHGGISLLITYPYEDGSNAHVYFRRKGKYVGISLIPNQGSHTQKIPPITSVKDNNVNSAAGIFFDAIE